MKVDPKILHELILALGWEVDFEQPENLMIRYTSDNGFIDVWNGKKRVTIGIYEPNTRTVHYHRAYDIAGVEMTLNKFA